MSITPTDAHTARQIAQQCCLNIWNIPLDTPIRTDRLRELRRLTVGTSAVPLCVTPSRKWHQREKRTLKAIADGAGPATALAKLYKSHMMAARRNETIRAQQEAA